MLHPDSAQAIAASATVMQASLLVTDDISKKGSAGVAGSRREGRTVRHNVGVSQLTFGLDFAGYRVEEVIGRGGMGVIYRGTDLQLGRPVAIKLIAAEHAADPWVRRRFEREARLMASIDPNVIPVYAAGEQDGHLYLVMRYVREPICRPCCASTAGSRRLRRRGSWGRSRTPSTRRTHAASCTVISSLPTS